MIPSIFTVDIRVFLWLRSGIQDSRWEDLFYYASDLLAWSPLFIFIAILLAYSRPRNIGWNLFFGLGSCILSMQSAQILSTFFQEAAPYVVEFIRVDAVLPAYSPVLAYSLPDPAVAGLAGLILFAMMRLSPNHQRNTRFLAIIPFVFAIFRIGSGYCYPSHALLGIILGALIGFLLSRVVRNFEVVFINN